MHVVQTPSPWAMVANRWTWVPSTAAIASVSASQSCGNSWATWETGQCCWHSCSPTTGSSRTDGGVAALGEHPRERLGGRQVGVGRHDVGVVALDEGHPAAGELDHGLLALRLGEEPHGLHRQVVVLLVEAVAPGLGEREDLRGPAASAGAVDLLVARLHDSLVGEVVEVTAYGGGGEVEPAGQVGGGGGAVLEDRARHTVTRGRVALTLCRRVLGNSTTPVCR